MERRQGTASAVPKKDEEREAALAAEAMAVPKRQRNFPGTYFVTSRTWQSRKLFIKENVCELFVETLLHYREEAAYELHSFVLMPEHFHVLITPAEDTTLERVVQRIKGGSSHRIREQLSYRFPIWQRGYSDHRIRDAEDFTIHVRYIEENPVKRMLAADASHYRWLSACGHFEVDDIPQRLKPLSMAAPLRHG